MANSSTTKGKTQKPPKPYEGFPLFPHATRRWAKKIRGRLYYFGSWDGGWKAALAKFEEERDALYAGKVPRSRQSAEPEGLKLVDLYNEFMAAMEDRIALGTLAQSTLDDYQRTCELILLHLGTERLVSDIRPADWSKLLVTVSKGKGGPGKKAQPWSHVTQADFVTRAKVPFRWARKMELIPVEMNYGPDFRKPAADKMDAERQSKPEKLFGRDEVLALIKGAQQPLKAMIMLGINCAYGNGDVAALPLSAINLKTEWVDFPRPKTAVPRRCKLWPETIETINAWLELRASVPGASGSNLAFLRDDGRPWSSENSGDNPIANVFSILVKSLGLQQTGRGFYSLRHTFRTEADSTLDDVAIDRCMGHKTPGIASKYRHRVDDHRIERVCNHVRSWLYGAEGGDRE